MPWRRWRGADDPTSDALESSIQKVTDLGAIGVIVPTVDDALEGATQRGSPATRRLAAAARRRLVRTGVAGSQLSRHRERQHARVVMIETLEGVANAEEIAATHGVDVVLIGNNDLSSFSGWPQNDPRYQDALIKVHDAALKYGKYFGNAGAQYLNGYVLSADTRMVQNGPARDGWTPRGGGPGRGRSGRGAGRPRSRRQRARAGSRTGHRPSRRRAARHVRDRLRDAADADSNGRRVDASRAAGDHRAGCNRVRDARRAAVEIVLVRRLHDRAGGGRREDLRRQVRELPRCRSGGHRARPALAGGMFLDSWHGRDLRRLLERIDTMPPAAPKSLSPAESVAVLAFLLRAAEMPPPAGERCRPIARNWLRSRSSARGRRRPERTGRRTAHGCCTGRTAAQRAGGADLGGPSVMAHLRQQPREPPLLARRPDHQGQLQQAARSRGG